MKLKGLKKEKRNLERKEERDVIMVSNMAWELWRIAGPGAPLYYLESLNDHDYDSSKPITTPYDYSQRARKKIKDQDYVGAIYDFTEAIRLSPDQADFYADRGFCRYMLKQHQGAMEDAENAIRFDSGLVQGFVLKGLVRRALGDIAGAISALSEGIRRGERAVQYACLVRAECYYELDDFGKSVEDCNRAIHLKPTAAAYRLKAWSHFWLRNYETAIQDFETVIALGSPQPSDFWGIGRARHKRGDYAGALEDFNWVIIQNPDHPWAFYDRALLWYELGEYNKAIDDFNEHIHINPHFPWAYMDRGDCLQKLGHYKGAMDDFLRAAHLFKEQNLEDKADKARKRFAELLFAL